MRDFSEPSPVCQYVMIMKTTEFIYILAPIEGTSIQTRSVSLHVHESPEVKLTRIFDGEMEYPAMLLVILVGKVEITGFTKNSPTPPKN